MTRDELIAKLMDMAANPPTEAEIAAHNAARTDPWRWYCRICGEKGDAGTEAARDDLARAHLDGTSCGRHGALGWETAGRLLHVWTFRPSAAAQWN